MTDMLDQLPRNLGLDLMRATEAAALTAAHWMGRGKRSEADHSASASIFEALKPVEMDGCLVLGEEARLREKASFRSGTKSGSGAGSPVDLILDPIDGRQLLANGFSGAISVLAAVPRGAFWVPSRAIYLEKIVVNAEVAEALVPECMNAPPAWILALVARAKKKKVSDLTVFMLARHRHEVLMEEIRIAGARVILRSDGDIAGALMAASENTGIDVLMGIGGAMEGLISACAVKALGGGMLCRLAPQSADERHSVLEAGLDIEQILSVQEMVRSRCFYFVATGITDGPILRGVSFQGSKAVTHSLILQGETRTRRNVFAEHRMDI